MTPTSKARAQCGSPARWDLCGGRAENARPYRDRSPTSIQPPVPQSRPILQSITRPRLSSPTAAEATMACAA
jgi:hypothetical protein